MKKVTIGYITIIALLTLTIIVSLRLFLRQRSDHDIIDIQTFPHTIGDWKGKDLEITELEYSILETRNLILREYVNSAEQNIYLFIVYSETNRSVFHPPEVCLIGSGITITYKKTEKVNFEKKGFLTNKLYLEKNNHRDIALYCYKAGNLYTDNFYRQQIYFAFNQLIGKRCEGATIRVLMPRLESEEETLATLKSFMKETIKNLENL